MSQIVASPTPMANLRVSYSSLNVAESCWRKFELDKLYPKRIRGDEDWYAADVGKALHAGFQSWLTHKDRERAIWDFMLVFPYQGEYTQKNDGRSFDAALSTLELMIDDVQLSEYELAMIRRPNTPKEIEAGMSGGVVVPAIEVPFEIRFKGITLPDGRGVSFIGYIDAIMQHYITQMFRTMDIKTTRMHVPDSTAKFKFDDQQIPYGIVVDHIALGEIDSFEVLYLDCYIDLVEPKVNMYPFMKSQDDIQEWVANKMLQLQNLQRFMASDYFPRTGGGCMFFNKPCRYLEPCTSRDRDTLNEWFLLGEEAADDREEFHPWIVAEIDVGV